jgi:hypothetical protein
MKKYHVISPDGFPIRPDPFTSIKQAAEYTRKWCEAFKQQGYYLTGGRQKIPADELVNHLRMVPANKLYAIEEHTISMRQPISERSLATVRTAVREQWEQEQQAGRNEASTPQSPAKSKCLKPDEPER